jgi:hypothetical protein
MTRGPFRPRALKELSAPVTSVEDLRRVAHRAALRHPPTRLVVEHPNPQVRFVASVDTRADLRRVAEMLPAERSAIVRRAFAQRLGADRALPPAASVEEAVYIFEPEPSDSEDPRLRTLAAMMRLRELHPANRALAAEFGFDDGRDFPPEVEKFDEALRAGLRYSDRAALSIPAPSGLRACARRLSPFEEGGLGTFDELQCIADIDTAYLTIMQLLFLTELGLLAEP